MDANSSAIERKSIATVTISLEAMRVPPMLGATMNIRLVMVGIAVVLIPVTAQHAAIRAKILAVAEGRAEEVRQEIPALLEKYPNDPGVLFLSAIVERDGSKAVQTYRRIVRDFPTSEWADDSQWRIVQYYALLRDTANARAALAEYQQRYPLSEFLVHAREIVQSTVGLGAEMPQRVEIGIAGTGQPSRQNESSNVHSKDKRYSLQIGAYSTKESAEREAEKFRAQRLRVEVIEKAPSLFAVTIGDYSTREAAEKARSLVEEQCRCTPFIIVKESSPPLKQPPKRSAK